jgi:S-methylmethionine-dependent homocysteine/selenocysteine methylase
METTILDGGMGRELMRSGAPFRQPEWSALALIEAPETVRAVHRSYVAAGADVITTNSYALVPFHIGEDRFAGQGRDLTELAGRVAREAVEGSSTRVAASLPPLFGSYRPDLYDPEQARNILKVLIEGLSPHADIWLGETLSSLVEARNVVAGLEGDGRPLWLSFTLADAAAEPETLGNLRSGESVAAAAELASGTGAAALLFNCSQPEVMLKAVETALTVRERLGASFEVGVYANAFPPQEKEAQANETILPLRADLDPPGYLGWLRSWRQAGATILGGCCGIGPEHIAELRQASLDGVI